MADFLANLIKTEQKPPEPRIQWNRLLQDPPNRAEISAPVSGAKYQGMVGPSAKSSKLISMPEKPSSTHRLEDGSLRSNFHCISLPQTKMHEGIYSGAKSTSKKRKLTGLA